MKCCHNPRLGLKSAYWVLGLCFLALSLVGCQREEWLPAEAQELAFSCDTMAFDTVFTQMGTTTRYFMVYNRSHRNVRIASIGLQGGYASRFRLNVDGDTSMVARDVDIAAGDSLFVFVRANINPSDATSPFLIEDAVRLTLADGVLRLPLTAYGRNAVYHVPTDTLRYADGSNPLDMFGNPYAYSVIDCAAWRHDLPHVVLGYAVVDSRQTLQLLPGDELYFATDAVLWVYDSATLDVRGSAEQPVLMTSLRHDGHYDGLPGQWGFVWLSKGSVGSHIEEAVVENGYVGLLVDSCADYRPTLTLSHTQVRNHTLAGLLGQTAHIEADNLLITNCGTATVVLQYGGRYNFRYCTFADYWRYEMRSTPSVLVTNFRDYEGTRYVWPMQAQMRDCILYGSRDSELYVELDSAATVSATFPHCLVRGGEWDEDPLFVDPAAGDYHLQEDSPAWGIGYQFQDGR